MSLCKYPIVYYKSNIANSSQTIFQSILMVPIVTSLNCYVVNYEADPKEIERDHLQWNE